MARHQAIRGMILEVIPVIPNGRPIMPAPSQCAGAEQLWWSPFHDRYFSSYDSVDQDDLKPISREEAQGRWPGIEAGSLASTGVIFFDGSGSNTEHEMIVADWRSESDQVMAQAVCVAFGIVMGSEEHKRFLGCRRAAGRRATEWEVAEEEAEEEAEGEDAEREAEFDRGALQENLYAPTEGLAISS